MPDSQLILTASGTSRPAIGRRSLCGFFAVIACLLFVDVFNSMAADDESLRFFEEEAQVSVTASRRPQPVQEAPVAIDVITQEEIRASSATNIWDLLRFRVGMDVVEGRSADGNRAIASVRGFPQEYVDNLQVLIDGRSVYNLYEGGVNWSQIPVQFQDIDRIEIVRGPNAALYGSNSGLGVINIITKSPEGKSGASAYAIGGNLETSMGGAAVNISRERFFSRLSYSYWHEEGFSNAPNPLFAARDALNSNKLNYRGLLIPSDGTRLELFAGGSWDKQGLTFADLNGTFRTYFGMARLGQRLGANSSLEIMLARNSYYNNVFPDFEGNESIQYTQDDIEAVHRFSWWNNRLKTTWGGNYRSTVSDSERIFASAPLPGTPVDSVHKIPFRRVFLHQSIDVSSTLTLVGAASIEHSNLGGMEPAYQAAAVISPSKDHTFRVSYSRAPTTPNTYDAFVNIQYTPPPFSIFEHGNPEFKPQVLQSYEVGYKGTYLDRKVEVDSDLFYMDINHIRLYTESFDPIQVIDTFGVSYDEAAIARGAEAKLTYRIGPARSVYVNYTYEYITDRLGDARITQSTPRNKVNFGGMASLGQGFSGAVNVGYKSRYVISSADVFASVEVPPYWRLDARVSYKPSQHLEFFIAGKNLADPRHVEFQDSLEVARTYYGGMMLEF